MLARRMRNVCFLGQAPGSMGNSIKLLNGETGISAVRRGWNGGEGRGGGVERKGIEGRRKEETLNGPRRKRAQQRARNEGNGEMKSRSRFSSLRLTRPK